MESRLSRYTLPYSTKEKKVSTSLLKAVILMAPLLSLTIKLKNLPCPFWNVRTSDLQVTRACTSNLCELVVNLISPIRVAGDHALHLYIYDVTTWQHNDSPWHVSDITLKIVYKHMQQGFFIVWRTDGLTDGRSFPSSTVACDLQLQLFDIGMPHLCPYPCAHMEIDDVIRI